MKLLKIITASTLLTAGCSTAFSVPPVVRNGYDTNDTHSVDLRVVRSDGSNPGTNVSLYGTTTLVNEATGTPFQFIPGLGVLQLNGNLDLLNHGLTAGVSLLGNSTLGNGTSLFSDTLGIQNTFLTPHTLIASGALNAEVSATVSSPLQFSSGDVLGFANQSANTVFSGPVSGAAAAPGFRALVAADYGTVPSMADYNGAQGYSVSTSNGVSMWVRRGVQGTRRVEYCEDQGSGTANIFGNQIAAIAGTLIHVGPLAGVPSTLRWFTAAGGGVASGFNVNNLSASWSIPTCFTFIGNPTNITSLRCGIGLTSGTALATINNADPKTLHVMMFQLDTGAANPTHWKLYTCDGGGTSTITDTGVVASTNAACYEIVWDKVNNRVVAFINGAAVAANTTHLPAAPMRSFGAVYALTALVQGIDMEWWQLSQDFFPSMP